MSFYREITVNEKVYKYHIGSSGVKIHARPSFFIGMDKLTGHLWASAHDARPQIGPADVKRLIIENKLEPA
jgi:hypothetical protein